MTDERPDVFERNLEDLIRQGALPVSEDSLEKARRGFMDRVAGSLKSRPASTVGRTHIWRLIAMAASIPVCILVLWSLFGPVKPKEVAAPRLKESPAPVVPPNDRPEERQEPRPPSARAEQAREETRLLEPANPPVKEGVTLFFRPPVGMAPLRTLRIEGTAALPDRVVLKLGLFRVEEAFEEGRLVQKARDQAATLVEVSRQRFSEDLAVDAPGQYRVTVDLLDDFQRPEVAKALRGSTPVRSWTFGIAGWGDGMMARIDPLLREVDGLAEEARGLIAKFERACVSQDAWATQARTLLREGERFLSKIDGSRVALFYPAAVNEILFTVRELVTSAQYFRWKGGKFGAEDYHHNFEPLKTFRKEEFGFAALRKYADEACAVAGREFALWGVKELRRGGRPAAVAEALKGNETRPGLAAFAARLVKAAAEDLDALESDIRAAK